MYSKIKEVFKWLESWEDKEINIKTLQNEGFKNYVKDLDLFIDRDKKKFYKIIKSLIKNKKGKFVNGIKVWETILTGK